MIIHRENSQALYPHIDFTGMSFDEIQAARLAAITPPFNQPDERTLLAWLKRRGPDAWHRSAATWNWDQDLKVMEWVIRNPRCDAGTAVTLFARGEPGYYAQFATMAELEAGAGYMMETVRFLIEICERWAAGQYSSWRFRPEALPQVAPGSLPWPVPETLARAEAQGEPLDLTGWNEGFPPELLAAPR